MVRKLGRSSKAGGACQSLSSDMAAARRHGAYPRPSLFSGIADCLFRWWGPSV